MPQCANTISLQGLPSPRITQRTLRRLKFDPQHDLSDMSDSVPSPAWSAQHQSLRDEADRQRSIEITALNGRVRNSASKQSLSSFPCLQFESPALEPTNFLTSLNDTHQQ